MKIAILTLLYLAAPALMVPDKLPELEPKSAKTTVIYKSETMPVIPVSSDVPYVVDEENCEEELVDFERPEAGGLQRYTMLRVE